MKYITRSFLFALALGLLPFGVALTAPRAVAAPSPEGAEVYFISPKDGEVVRGPVVVRFGLKGMGISPAGIEVPGTGHHHLILDAPLPDLSKAIPTDDNHLHYGLGQTEVALTLAPGKHTLQLLLGDHLHVPHTPALFSKQITITVAP
ncbi:rod shape-determining protein RodA [Cephaloticoccus primus]|uniref:Rod shape-determining protein RodA n=1 Tax=Cephaloticoccus primus TaxID=1548207 RepID=A0A139SJ04_9BACT|nr:DUF4399 domain-containing protein [Cephaloticoccus primus]KXU34474.1 rod shape-determining protein RodA [Cephaloticoccus primus]